MRTPVPGLPSALVALVLVCSCSAGSELIAAADIATDDLAATDAATASDQSSVWPDDAAPEMSAPDLLQPDMNSGWECVEDSDCAGLAALPACRLYECSDEHLCIAADAPDGAPCQPDELCFQSGTCLASSCVADLPLVCNDENPCTEDSCDPTAGCVTIPLDGPCDDGDACTDGDGCAESVCTGVAMDCNDENPCTADSCDPQTGCLHTNQDGACEDGDPCTVGDICVGGGCTAAENICECYTDDDCYAYLLEDCVQTTFCNTSEPPFVCEVKELECADTGSICGTAQCNPLLGECEILAANEGAECQEPLNCVVDGLCQAGTCSGQEVECVDDNPCTQDACIMGMGCQFLPAIVPCDDGDPCTVNDFCNLDGECLGLDTGCQELPTLGLKLTSLVFEEPGFCLPSAVPGQDCTDATALVNSFVEDDIQSADDPLVMLGNFAPFDLDGDSSTFALGPGNCTFDNQGVLVGCSFVGVPSSMEPVTYHGDTACLTEAGQESSAPCFHVAGNSIEVGIMDIVIPISQAEVTGTFLGMPEPGQISQGHIDAFLQKSVTDVIKVTLPLMPPLQLSDLLDASDLITVNGEAGWPLLIHFTATTVPVK